MTLDKEKSEMSETLDKSIARVYNKFKLHLYGQILRDMTNKEEETLSVQEVVYLELITALRHPTINEFASYAKLSGPNAAYRINRLISKGYVRKTQSPRDKREYHLHATPKYRQNYGSAMRYINTVADRIRDRFSEEDVEKFDGMLRIISSELMPEMHSLNTNTFEPETEEKTGSGKED